MLSITTLQKNKLQSAVCPPDYHVIINTHKVISGQYMCSSAYRHS